MDSVLSGLGTLINNIKNLTLPGLVAAFAFAVLLWPPQPIDVVTDAQLNPAYKTWPSTKSGLTALANLERPRLKKEKATDESPESKKKNDEFGPVCWTQRGTATPEKPTPEKPIPPPAPITGQERTLRQPQSFPENKPVALANQYDLEQIQRRLQDCADKETALSGAEQSQVQDITAEISVLTAERDALRDTYVGYEKTENPLRATFLDKLDKKEDEIRAKQQELHAEEQLQRERDRRGKELKNLSDEVKLRLQEPGRLRPLQKFDDFLASLGTHVVAFLSLALGWSLIFEPVNRAGFGYAYETSFDEQLDYARDDRKPLFVYTKTQTSATKWWWLPVAVGLPGVFLLVWFSKPWPTAPDRKSTR